MRAFLQRHLDPVDRLGEVLFGLIMALGFTGAVRLGQEEADNWALFIGIGGCNLAWAIVDGVMFVLAELFERGRKARVIRDVLRTADEEAALQRIEVELDGPLVSLTTAAERRQLARAALMLARRTPAERPTVQFRDLLGGAAVALIIVLATLPVVIPFLVVPDPSVAVRVSNAIALTELFLTGAWWGREVGGSPLRIATGLTAVGVVLVLITIALGG
ncbi:MAG: VIT1/CCC1 transporter family protein [Candidatus Binatia bacterium]